MTSTRSLPLALIPVDQLPGTPPLLRDTLAGEARLPFGFELDASDVGWRVAASHEARFDRPRRAIADALHAQNAPFKPPQPVLDNIEALADPTTLAVVTGQQVGLAGGPLLTLYKAMTAVALAEQMQATTGIRTVPVFWMATSDHNLVEATQLHWINTRNELASYKFTPGTNRTPVGWLKLGQHANALQDQLLPDLPKTDFSDTFTERLSNAYTPEHTFAQAFRSLGLSLLGRHGVVFLDPEDPELKRLSSPFLQHAVADVDERLERMAGRCRDIQHSGYKVQAPVEAGRPAIFLIENDQRRKVVLEGKAIRGHSDIILSRDELLRLATEEPESLSTGVTLRPLLQSWLLPTAAYVAGPHELAYWSELAGSFEPLGLNPPAVVPRASLTLIEPKVRRWLNKLQLDPVDLFTQMDSLTARLLPRDDEAGPSAVCDELDASLKQFEEQFRTLTRQPDFAGLKTAVDTSFRKMQYHADKLRHSFSDRSQRRHGDLLNQLNQLSTHLNPGGSPQERVITPFYYLVRYGDALLDGIHGAATAAIGHHGFVDLQELTS